MHRDIRVFRSFCTRRAVFSVKKSVNNRRFQENPKIVDGVLRERSLTLKKEFFDPVHNARAGLMPSGQGGLFRMDLRPLLTTSSPLKIRMFRLTIYINRQIVRIFHLK